MKPTWCTPIHQGLFNMVPRMHQEALWFGRSQLDKHNKQTTLLHR